MKKENVGILISTLKNGGAQRVASNLSLHLPEELNKYIFLYDTKEIGYSYQGDLIDLRTPASDNFFTKIKYFFTRIYKMKKLKSKYDIETTISLLTAPNIINLLSELGDKIIISERTFPSRELGFYWNVYKILRRFLYNKADEIVAISKGVKKDLIENFGIEEDKITVIYNPCDEKKIKTLSNKELDDKYKKIFSNPVIITVGRLNKVKGQWHLIRAFKKVKRFVSKAKLVILGQGELRSYLEHLCDDLNLEDDIHFLGFKNNPFKFMKKSTVFAFPSLHEGFGNVITEAMACGIPVVSTDCQAGPREIIAPDTSIEKKIKAIEYAKYGVLVPTCDGNQYNSRESLTEEENLLAEALIRMIRNDKMKNKYCTASKRRIKDFNSNHIMRQWLELINK